LRREINTHTKPLKQTTMSVNYQLFRNPDPNKGEEQSPLHARIVPKGTRSITEMMEYAKSFSSLSTADVKAALQLVSELLEQSLRDGYNVELDGIGYFSASLSCRPVMDKKEIRGESIKFKNVNFRCDKKLKHRLSSMSFFRAEEEREESFSSEERKARILRLLERREFISCQSYMSLNNCSQYMALKELKELIGSGQVKVVGGRTTRMYRLGERR